ncbi:MAG: thioredoxin domain-containing protein [Thermoplasmatota archaeon]
MSGATARKPNRLASESSPYLRQHAHNPVDWWPWGEAAFAEARRRDVPVFLSIGYATCHWCHVMAHESFEDAGVAARMNNAFVCVKVDREERPDVDDVYMAACQMMTGSGGWPLTVLLTPDKKPFFAGTYFPKESRYGRIGMLDLVARIAEAWRDKRSELQAQADHMLLHLSGTPHGHGDEPDATPASPATDGLGLRTLQAGRDALAARFDAKRGGFGAAPKFPSPRHVMFLLRSWSRDKDPQTLAMVTLTLDAMARGGLRDHLGGGFHRYSTDADWLWPHFEKMLYDQAMLAMAYTEAFQATADVRHEAIVRSTLDYVLRDLSDPAGGFRCAEDADSEGVEGKFYVWSKTEIVATLGPVEGEAFCKAYGVTAEGNVHDEATHKKTGVNVLHLAVPEDPRLAAACSKLLAVQAKRVRPSLDDKVLTDWNGLAIAAFAKAGAALGEPRYLQASTRAAEFLHKTMRRADGRLRHRYHAGKTDEVSFLDDHAFLLWGLVELYGSTFEPKWLAWAAEVAAHLEKRLADPAGGFFQSPSDGEDLGVRRKEAYDGAMPSCNSAAAYALHKLGLLTGDPRWTGLADRTIAAFASGLSAQPQAFTMMLSALDLGFGPTQEVVVAGEGALSDAMVAAAGSGFHPRRVVLAVRPGLANVAPWTAQHTAPVGAARAFVCEGFACKTPVTTVAGLKVALGDGS